MQPRVQTRSSDESIPAQMRKPHLRSKCGASPYQTTPPAGEHRARAMPGRARFLIALLSATLAALRSSGCCAPAVRAGAPPRCSGPRRYPRPPGGGLRVAPTSVVLAALAGAVPLGAVPVLNPPGLLRLVWRRGPPVWRFGPVGPCGRGVAAAARFPRRSCGSGRSPVPPPSALCSGLRPGGVWGSGGPSGLRPLRLRCASGPVPRPDCSRRAPSDPIRSYPERAMILHRKPKAFRPRPTSHLSRPVKGIVPRRWLGKTAQGSCAATVRPVTVRFQLRY